jgi:metal-responsive CopG/Arc/MetJ family transcriptional regulator
MQTAFQMRVGEDFLHRLDEWRRAQPDLPGRSEAIRRLVTEGIERAGIKAKRVRKPRKDDQAE